MAKDTEVFSMTPDQLQAMIQGAVAAAVAAAVPSRKLTGAEFHAKVQRIKNHEGEFAKRPLTLVPPAGHAIISDKIGQSPKLVELNMVLHQGASVRPFKQGRGERKGPVVTGQMYGKVIDGEIRLLAFTPYADGLVVNRKREKVDQSLLYPDFGSGDAPVPITNSMVLDGGTYFDKGYLEGVVKPAQAAAKKGA